MATRGAGIQTLGAAAQPVFGTTLTAAFTPTPDSYTGNYEPRSQPAHATVAVASTAWFRVGDKAGIGPAGGPYDFFRITAIGSATAMTLTGGTKAHASGEFVILGVDAARIKIDMTTVGATTDITYIGEDNTVGSTSTTLFAIISGATTGIPIVGGGYDIGQSSVGNVYGTSHYWILGTSGDKYLASITTV